MKKLSVVITALAAMSPLPAVAQNAHGVSCSNATIKGSYAFQVDAWILTDGVYVPTFVTGITTYDGNGKLVQTDYQQRYGVPVEFTTTENGTYTINQNCTGSAHVNLNTPGFPSALGGSIDLGIVISSDGNSIHGVVGQFTNPGSATPAPPSNIHQDRVDSWKISTQQDQQ